MRSGGPFAVGDKVLVVDAKNRRYLVTLREGGQFHTHAGFIPHEQFVGQPEGTTLRSSSGSKYLTLRPTLSDFVLSMPRGAQVVYPKDLGPLLILADVYQGARILEAGVGSGALSMAMLQAGASVTGYEIRADFATVALQERPLASSAPTSTTASRSATSTTASMWGDRRGRPRPGRPRPPRAVAGGQARRGRPPPGRDLRVLPAHHRPGGPAPRGPRRQRLRPGPDHRGAPAVVARGRPVGAPRPPDGGPHRLPHLGPPAGARQPLPGALTRPPPGGRDRPGGRRRRPPVPES